MLISIKNQTLLFSEKLIVYSKILFLMFLMFLKAFKSAVCIGIKGFGAPLKDVYTPIKRRLYTH